VPFVGEPRLMQLHQLLMSPMFGLESMDSVAVEKARDTARKLHTRTAARGKALTPRERMQLERSTEVLSAAPEWDAVPDYARQQNALLKELKATIAKQAAAGSAAGKAVPAAASAKKTAARKGVAKDTPALSPTKLRAAVKRVEKAK